MSKLQGKFYHFDNEKLGRLCMVVRDEHKAQFMTKQPYKVGRLFIYPDLSTKDELYHFLQTSIAYLEVASNYRNLAEAEYTHDKGVDAALLCFISVNQQARYKKLGTQALQGVMNEIKKDKCTVLRGQSVLKSVGFYETVGASFETGTWFNLDTDNPKLDPGEKFKFDPIRSEWATEIFND